MIVSFLSRTSLAVALVILGRPSPAAAEDPGPAPASTVSARSSSTSIGLGLALGHPTAVSLRVPLDAARTLLLQGGIGTGTLDGTGLHVHADLLWSPATLTSTPSYRLPLYLGGGIRFFDRHYDTRYRYDEGRETRVGVRVPVGVTMQFLDQPLDLFAEAAFLLDLIESDACFYDGTSPYCEQDRALGVGLGVGGHYYF